jgi:uncharacterized membrane protein
MLPSVSVDSLASKVKTSPFRVKVKLAVGATLLPRTSVMATDLRLPSNVICAIDGVESVITSMNPANANWQIGFGIVKAFSDVFIALKIIISGLREWVKSICE